MRIIAHRYQAERSDCGGITDDFLSRQYEGGITRIGVRSATHGGVKMPVVYLTPRRDYALFYIRDTGINYVTCGVTAEGYIRYDERFPGQLRRLYCGQSGYLYRCDGPVGVWETATRGVWVSKEPVDVDSVEYIPDAYEEILKYEASGEVKVAHYETLTDVQKRESFDMAVSSIYRLGLLGKSTAKSDFYRESFPAAWDYAAAHPEEKEARVED